MTTVIISTISRRIGVSRSSSTIRRISCASMPTGNRRISCWSVSDLNEAFAGRRRWCDLSPTHYRFLIMETLNKMAALTDEEQADDTNPTMVSLTFILTAFIKLLENVTESTIELLRLNRLGDHEVLYDYAGSINMHLDSIRPKRDGLRVIVDNT